MLYNRYMPISITNLLDLQQVCKSDWVAIYNITLDSVIIGYIHFKNLVNNQILVEHWLHFIDKVDKFPLYTKPLVSHCPRCTRMFLYMQKLKNTKENTVFY